MNRLALFFLLLLSGCAEGAGLSGSSEVLVTDRIVGEGAICLRQWPVV